MGPNHPDVARSLNNLAAALPDAGRADRARPLQERAVAIAEATSADNTRTPSSCAATWRPRQAPGDAARCTRRRTSRAHHAETATATGEAAPSPAGCPIRGPNRRHRRRPAPAVGRLRRAARGRPRGRPSRRGVERLAVRFPLLGELELQAPQVGRGRGQGHLLPGARRLVPEPRRKRRPFARELRKAGGPAGSRGRDREGTASGCCAGLAEQFAAAVADGSEVHEVPGFASISGRRPTPSTATWPSRCDRSVTRRGAIAAMDRSSSAGAARHGSSSSPSSGRASPAALEAAGFRLERRGAVMALRAARPGPAPRGCRRRHTCWPWTNRRPAGGASWPAPPRHSASGGGRWSAGRAGTVRRRPRPRHAGRGGGGRRRGDAGQRRQPDRAGRWRSWPGSGRGALAPPRLRASVCACCSSGSSPAAASSPGCRRRHGERRALSQPGLRAVRYAAQLRAPGRPPLDLRRLRPPLSPPRGDLRRPACGHVKQAAKGSGSPASPAVLLAGFFVGATARDADQDPERPAGLREAAAGRRAPDRRERGAAPGHPADAGGPAQPDAREAQDRDPAGAPARRHAAPGRAHAAHHLDLPPEHGAAVAPAVVLPDLGRGPGA